MKHWILKNGVPIPVSDLLTFGRWFENADRSIDQTTVGDAQVSTVFLGIDHRFGGDGPPILFETMIFGGKYDQWGMRYCTLGEAKAGHWRVVEALRAGQDPEAA